MKKFTRPAAVLNSVTPRLFDLPRSDRLRVERFQYLEICTAQCGHSLSARRPLPLRGTRLSRGAPSARSSAPHSRAQAPPGPAAPGPLHLRVRQPADLEDLQDRDTDQGAQEEGRRLHWGECGGLIQAEGSARSCAFRSSCARRASIASKRAFSLPCVVTENHSAMLLPSIPPVLASQ